MARHRKLIQKVRRRRSPELARQELLDAAERLFRDLPPDQVGLKDIGREADVSHALVTHYFGTYVGVVAYRVVSPILAAMLSWLPYPAGITRGGD